MFRKRGESEFIYSALNTPLLNYRVYVMNAQERMMTFLLAFVVGGMIGLVFYGGLFRDADGLATIATSISNGVVFIVAGIIASFVFYPVRCRQLKEKRKHELTLQFRSLLEALSVSLSSGMNMSESLLSAYGDLKGQYSDKAYIVSELKEMIDGIQNNVSIEVMMKSLGERSQIEDIKNFGIVFEISYRVGGNMKDIVRKTNSIIGEKIEIASEIETALASNKSQLKAMMVIPIVIVMMLRLMSSTFATSFATVGGVISMTIAIALFIIAYKLGQGIMDVKG